jgi:dienelactone hydrolase
MRLTNPSVTLFLLLAIPCFVRAADSSAAVPATDEKVDTWNGYTRHMFTVDGCQAWVVEPKQTLPGKPWSWCMEFPDAFTERCAAPALLAKGFHHVHIVVGNTFGCPAAVRHFNAFYEVLQNRGLAKKAVLIGLSRGGLYAYRWASENPDKVAVIYGDAPVCDFKSWPGGRGKGAGSPGDWKDLLTYYGFKDEAEALAYRGNPIDTLEPLAKAGIALIHVVGDADDAVPVAENTAIMEARYKKLGGEIQVIHKPGIGHHPHGLDDPAPVVKFIVDHATLRRGDAWSEETAKKKLEEYAQTWSDRASWEKRAAAIREGILRGTGLLPLPPRTALNPIVREERKHDGYTVQNVAFESLPGFFVTGNLYRPTSQPPSGRSAGILVTHGHCTGTATPFAVNKTGGRFGGETQRICAVLARMGAVVFAYDMTGVNEASQYPHTGPMAMSVQLWDSMRAVDFLTSQPQVDPARIGITGASGGGTQSFLLAAVDERVTVSIPVVQVSAHFFGGCICESGMPIHVSDRHDTCNAEIAALHAPKPMLVISDGKDWTKNTPLVEFPYIRSVYRAYGAENAVENLHLAQEGHDYGPSKRQGTYAFFAKHLGLSLDAAPRKDGKIDESFVTSETYEVLCVFDGEHPRPAGALNDPAAVEAWLRGSRNP